MTYQRDIALFADASLQGVETQLADITHSDADPDVEPADPPSPSSAGV